MTATNMFSIFCGFSCSPPPLVNLALLSSSLSIAHQGYRKCDWEGGGGETVTFQIMGGQCCNREPMAYNKGDLWTRSSFIAILKKNISSRFATHDIVSALAIFGLRNIPSTDSSQFPPYGKKSIEVLLNHCRKDKFALPLNDE